eukprot:m.20097 g.20097  ORF g.20097 m.20097 type:complete len:328 (-) comp5217_c0_seq1:1641-2624(-)
MPVDLSTNSAEIKAAKDAVCSDDNSVTWAIFGYKGDTLKVVDQDNTDLEEFLEEFEGSKIQYGFIKVTDPNQAVDKFVLINWSGEGAPVLRKGQCAHHVRDVENYFRAHVTINARTETDLDADAILKLVAKSSGAAYSNHKEAARPEFSSKSDKVGSSYTNEFKSAGIATNEERSKFWQDQQGAEEARKKEMQAKAEDEQRAIDEKRKEEEARRNAELEKQKEEEKIAQENEANAQAQAEAERQRREAEAQANVEVEAEPEQQPESTENEGLCAIAIYDYEAEEEGELSFDPEDRITNIEQIDEGWWQGWCKGVYGLFPANYVQVEE